MTDLPRPRLAYHLTEGAGPTLIFLPGYASDMQGTKALALEDWAQRGGRAFLRFDYGGCGESGGEFAAQTLVGWRDDVLAMIDQAVAGPVGLVGIAPAPDFTDWGFTTEEKMRLMRDGRIERPNPYGPAPTLYTRAFWTSGEANRVMHGAIAFAGPVRLVQGQRDPDVPWHRTGHLAELFGSADVQTWLVKDGDHRLSRDSDIALIVRAVEEVLARI